VAHWLGVLLGRRQRRGLAVDTIRRLGQSSPTLEDERRAAATDDAVVAFVLRHRARSALRQLMPARTPRP
jgi:hypothetical protein